MIAVTFALPVESSQFTRRLHDRTCGDLHGHSVVVLHTGVGGKIAQQRIRDFLQRAEKPRLLISAGFAGALDGRLQVGDLLLADNFSDAATRALLPAARGGKLASASAVTDSAADRQALAQRTGASAVDMETETIAVACAVAGIPMLSLRVISDTPAEPLPAPATVLFDLEKQKTPAGALALYLATHPAAVPRLLAFSKRIAAARTTLTNGLDLLLRGL